jgi:hypothetical protein
VATLSKLGFEALHSREKDEFILMSALGSYGLLNVFSTVIYLTSP